MTHADSAFDLRRLGARSLATLLALMLTTHSYAAQTDIASTPIITTTAALVKPNIMLLMDASGSMGRTHMPDEVETQTGPSSIGYKSAQCNALYYNPATSYYLPKDSLGVNFAAPAFNAAPYAGFGSFYLPPDSHPATDLNSQFVAYDATTLDVAPPVPDPPQAAYYFVYTGTVTPINFAQPPCTTKDTSSPNVGGDIPTLGGKWTKVIVKTLSTDDQNNFAIWYSFYRTRLSLIKSAASLAFSPLNDTKRVGFITVEPKDAPTSTVINPVRYLPLSDFNSTQKSAWFSKVFSQVPHGASPAREGLARVGRYYGGKEDGINGGMPATGNADPIQYACQQNFTIMTTDGYWNGQSETPTNGTTYGGGLMLDGMTKVGQQDGDPTCPLSDPYCPRPIFDGVSASTRVETNKTNAYTDNLCSLAGTYRSTYQTQRQVTNLTRDTSRTTNHTIQYKTSTRQAVAKTSQTIQKVTQTQQTTVQYVKHKEHYIEDHYQHVKSQEQTTQVTEQWELTTSQTVAQSFQTREVKKTLREVKDQWSTSTTQYVSTTTQYRMQTEQYKFGKVQIQMHQYQTIAYDHSNEHGDAIPGDCTASPGNYPIECRVTEVFYPAYVDPATCTTGPTPVITGPNNIKTTCIPGPQSTPYQAVPSCSPGPPAGPSNDWVVTTCDHLILQPFKAFDGTCDPATPTQTGGSDYFLYVCDRPPANNTSTPVSSCGASTPGTDPNWITTTCTQPVGPNNQPLAPSPQCDETQPPSVSPQLVTTTCVKSLHTDGNVATCNPDPGTSSPFIQVSCTPTPVSDKAVPSASCTPGTDGMMVITTCPKTPAGPDAVAHGSDSCMNGASTNDPDYFETTCTMPAGANNQTAFKTKADCGTEGVTPGSTPDFITRDCHRPVGANNQTAFADPTLCHDDPGTSYPYLKTTCTPNPTMPPTVIDPTDPTQNAGCTAADLNGPPTVGPGPDFIVTHCVKNDLSNSSVKGCSPAFSGPPDFIITTCGLVKNDEPVNFCVLGPLPDEGADAVTCMQLPGPNNTTINVATCSDGTLADFVHVTCSGPNTISQGAVDPATCYAGTSADANVYVTTCTEVPAGLYPTETGVAWPCTGGYDSVSQITTTCSTPTSTNTGEVNSPPCDETQSQTDSNQITTFCKKYDTTDYVPTSTCLSDTPQVGSGPAITCNTTYTYAEPVSTCDGGHVDGLPYYDTTQACHPTVTTPMADYAGTCTEGPDGTPGELISCNLRPLDVLVKDSGCHDGTDNATGIVTKCTTQYGGGHRYSVITTKTVTTTQYSGTVATSVPDVQTTASTSTDVDGVCYPSPQLLPPDPNAVAPFVPAPPVDAAFAPCAAWPCVKTTVGDGGSENSLADVAQYYYKTDLRPSMDNPPDRVGGPEDDKAGHQHMTTFTLGLGVSGTLTYRADYRSTSTVTGDFADIRTGVKNWPLWPDKTLDYTNSDNYNNPKSIDDFWHTAVNGRGRYFSANNPTSVIQGLGDALANIDAVTASGSAIGTSTLTPTSTDNFAYSTTYHSGTWDGDLTASVIDLSSGLPGPALWSAKALLGAKTFPDCDRRKILLFRGGTSLVDFTWNTVLCPSGPPGGAPVTSLNATEQDFFGPLNVSLLSQYPYMTDGTGTTAMQQQEAKKPGKLVNFLRGQTVNEGFTANSATQLFRTRDGALGDIVDSQPVYVKQPFADYADPGYSAFKAVTRTAMVYVGANDGMLHAFYANVDGSDPLHGQEAWAVIPSAVLPNLYKLADDNYKRDGHQFYVDGTPVVGDVFNGSWKTILVGSLNAGGKGYFALDISSPGATPTALWEFKQDATACPASPAAAAGNTGDCNLGLSFGKPVITKLAGTWVVMFTSGYNNVNSAANGADGQGFLYVLNALSGAVIYKIPTGAGDPGTPSGLGQINNFVDNVLIDNTTIRVYGGDVLGNMWRFDFLPSPTATLLGSAKDASSTIEPITVRPELAELDGKPFVMFGTGRLLGGSDVTDSHTQSVYGFRDPLIGSSPIYPDPIRNVLKPLKINTTAPSTKPDGTLDFSTVVRTITCTGSSVDCGRPTGWVLDLAEAGERVNVEMKLVVGALVFASNVPTQQPCTVVGHSYFNQIDFRTGAPIPNAVSSEFLADSINVGFTVLQLASSGGGSNPDYAGIFRQGNATNVKKKITPPEPTFLGKRISWREISQDK